MPVTNKGRRILREGNLTPAEAADELTRLMWDRGWDARPRAAVVLQKGRGVLRLENRANYLRDLLSEGYLTSDVRISLVVEIVSD